MKVDRNDPFAPSPSHLRAVEGLGPDLPYELWTYGNRWWLAAFWNGELVAILQRQVVRQDLPVPCFHVRIPGRGMRIDVPVHRVRTLPLRHWTSVLPGAEKRILLVTYPPWEKRHRRLVHFSSSESDPESEA